jgi:tripartite-type tricarboxylate transporter receptor subunit TctC
MTTSLKIWTHGHNVTVGLGVRQIVIGIFAVLVACTTASADEAVTFHDKSIAMIIGTPPGGGTDAAGRLVAQYLARHLPGKPSVIVRNIPGADGLVSLNYFSQQAKPDGLTVTMGASINVDPLQYRSQQAHYNPNKFEFIGGVGRGGTVILVQSAARKRLLNEDSSSVVMGAIGGVPRSGMLITMWGIEYLGWNAKWILGYPGTNDLMIALERGEIEMTSTGNMFQIEKLSQGDKFEVLTQSGTLRDGAIVGRPDFGDTPVFNDLIKDKITDPLAQKAFDFWRAQNSIDKWLALPERTPQEIVKIYRKAYKELGTDPDFIEQGRKMSEDFVPMSYQDIARLVKTLDETPAEATEFTNVLLRKQGVQVTH